MLDYIISVNQNDFVEVGLTMKQTRVFVIILFLTTLFNVQNVDVFLDWCLLSLLLNILYELSSYFTL